jgi:hypothetical protein
MSAHGKNPIDYERSDVDSRSIAQAGAVIGVVTVVAAVLVLFLFNFLFDRAKRADPPNPPLARHEQGQKPPEPRLQEAPFKDIASLRVEEEAVLESYAWVDERAGIARIPVEAALELVASKGLPRWAPVPAASPSPTPAPGKAK